MSKEQKQFKFVEEGTRLPVYTVFAVSETMAFKKLYRYLEKVGKKDPEMVQIEGRIND